MAKLIDYTYFIDKCDIPNIQDTGPVGTALQASIGRYLLRYEPEFLTDLLGETLYTALSAGLDEAEPAEVWTNLRDQIVDSTAKVSPIANFTWCQWYKDYAMSRTGIGDGHPEGGNIKIGTNNRRVATVWNDMVDVMADIADWVNERLDVYGDYAPEHVHDKYINDFGI